MTIYIKITLTIKYWTNISNNQNQQKKYIGYDIWDVWRNLYLTWNIYDLTIKKCANAKTPEPGL